MSETITIQIPRKTKEKLKKYDVNISEVVLKALEKCLCEIEKKDLQEKLERLKQFDYKINPELLAKLVREDRESH
jgi:hypothetical protein